MKRALWIVAAVILLALAGYAGYTVFARGQAPAAVEPTPTAAEEAQQVENVIWASGKLTPARWASMSFPGAGRLEAIDVVEGDQVGAGQLLAQLDDADARAAVAQADAALAAAQARQAVVQAPARLEQVAAAEAVLRAAQAALQAAQAGVATAEGNVTAAQAQAAVADASLVQVRAGARAEEIAGAREQLDLAQAVTAQAQTAYDRVASDPEIGMRPEAVALQQATASLRAAQARYDAAAKGATPEELAVASSQAGAARAQADVAETGVATAQAQVAGAQAAVAQAQAQLDLLKAGPREEDVILAQAGVREAHAALDAATAALEKLQLTAPFSGTVGTIYAHGGEVLTSGQEVLALGDLTTLRVETTDLRETDVARLAVGQQVDVTFDALPNRVFKGTITRLAPMATLDKGSVNYTAVVELAELDPALRWGMTAFVNITRE